MPNVFVSYSRESKDLALALATDIEELGHVVWFDRELSGGQAWWNEILASVRRCDAFVFVLTPQSLNSTACNREFGYAAALRKPILPVLMSEGVSANLLPPALAQVQFVDYRTADRAAGIRLARALTSLPAAVPLPDPLPAPPDVPTSYLGTLTQQIDGTSSLSIEQQSALLFDLKGGLRDGETAKDSIVLLKRLRKRRDTFAIIATEIDELLGMRIEPPPPPQPPPPPSPPPRLSMRARIIAAFCGAIAGLLVGILAFELGGSSGKTDLWPLCAAFGGAIAGAICGGQHRRIIAAVSGAALLWLLSAIMGGRDGIIIGGLFVAPGAAIVGAILAKYIWKSKPAAVPAARSHTQA